MGLYSGNPTEWIEDVYTFEPTDVVEGGEDGIDNVPIKNLSDRTAWLKANQGGIGAFTDVAVLDNNTELSMENHFGKLIAVNATGKVITITLKTASSYRRGTLFAIMAFNVNHAQVTVQTSAGQVFIDDASLRTKMYVGEGEKLWIVAGETAFYIADKKGNYETVGEPFYSHQDKPNAYRLLGQTFTSVSDPRLAEYAESLGVNLLPDSLREFVDSQDRKPYLGAFSKIDAITYRLPDFRGVVLRGLNLGSGRDLSRLWEEAGGYEPDAMPKHYHFTTVDEQVSNGGFPGQFGRQLNSIKAWIRQYIKTSGDGGEGYSAAGQSGSFPAQQPTIGPTSESGTSEESIVKNIGLIPLIRR